MKVEKINLRKSNGLEVTYYKFLLIIPNGIEISTDNFTKNNMILSYEDTEVSLDISCRDVLIIKEDFDYYLLIEETSLDIDKNIACLLDEDYIIEDMGVVFYDKHNNEVSLDIEPMEHVIEEKNNDNKILLQDDVRIGFDIVFKGEGIHDYDMFLMNKLYNNKVYPIFYNNQKGNGFTLEGDIHTNDIANIEPMESVSFNVNHINSNGFDILISSFDGNYKPHNIKSISMLITCNGVDYIYELNCDDFNDFNIDVNTKIIKILECEYIGDNYYLKPNITAYSKDINGLIPIIYGDIA